MISRCRFIENGVRAILTRGGAISFIDVMESSIDQCLFAGNEAQVGGALDVVKGGAHQLSSCTAVGGRSAFAGFAVVVAVQSLTVENCILRDNVGNNAGQVLLQGTSVFPVDLRDTNLEGGTSSITWVTVGPSGAVERLVDADPIFIDPLGPDGDATTFADNDYRLQSGSPSVDAGNSALILPDAADTNGNGNTAEPAALDLDGRTRRADDPATADTGVGAPPVIDHGAYER